ncbi:hypothetical protein L1887_00314 [Cichorium endivia]|nr:hypothetical protein L1887_00314 [Cichorium endivia]
MQCVQDKLGWLCFECRYSIVVHMMYGRLSLYMEIQMRWYDRSCFHESQPSPTPYRNSTQHHYPHPARFSQFVPGKDSELIDNLFLSKISNNRERIKVLVPEIPTPAGLVESLGYGLGRRVLCPVPLVVGLEEPPVVPNFLRDLETKGWVAVRVNAYETLWMGAECAAALVKRDGGCGVDVIVFTSTGEVEGMLKSLRGMDLNWGAVLRENPGMVVAAHGPVTAARAKSLEVDVNVVSSRFGSFDGVGDALALLWNNN